MEYCTIHETAEKWGISGSATSSIVRPRACGRCRTFRPRLGYTAHRQKTDGCAREERKIYKEKNRVEEVINGVV